uniref:archaea-specific SMC-related protein n=1 Tax=Natronobiforma cellulositropha TaxID=1679076 RepID=UPI0021D5AA36
MSVSDPLETPVAVTAENIGGIDRTTVSLEPGVNVLTGRNATNRTSFLQAIMAALGSDRPSLKGDADQGSATLAFGENTYTRSISRRNGHLVFDGDPYLEDAELADLFAFLLESNEARRAVGRGDDLRELIMRPIDTDEIQAQITLLETEKRDIDEQLADLERLAERLPELEAERVGLDDEIADLEAELETVETELEELDADVEESQAKKSDLERTFADLRRARQRLESARFDLETEREARSELEREREELEERLETIGGEETDSPARLEGRVQELRERKRALDTTLNDLQSVIRFNEERLEEGGIDLGEARAEGGDLTD